MRVFHCIEQSYLVFLYGETTGGNDCECAVRTVGCANRRVLVQTFMRKHSVGYHPDFRLEMPTHKTACRILRGHLNHGALVENGIPPDLHSRTVQKRILSHVNRGVQVLRMQVICGCENLSGSDCHLADFHLKQKRLLQMNYIGPVDSVLDYFPVDVGECVSLFAYQIVENGNLPVRKHELRKNIRAFVST